MSTIDSGFDGTIGALNTAMNLRLMNQNLISSNVANADTPNFKAKTMEFEQAFREILQSENDPKGGLKTIEDAVQPYVYEDPLTGVESLDGNTVNRAAELAKMSENQLLYDAAAEMIKKKLGMLKYSINEGGGNR